MCTQIINLSWSVHQAEGEERNEEAGKWGMESRKRVRKQFTVHSCVFYATEEFTVALESLTNLSNATYARSLLSSSYGHTNA